MAIYRVQSRLHRLNRPSWPFALNAASPQARGLLLWLAGGVYRSLEGSYGAVAPVGGATGGGTVEGSAFESVATGAYFTFPRVVVAVPFTVAMWVIRTDGGAASVMQTSGNGANVYAGAFLNLTTGGGLWEAHYGDGGVPGSNNRISAASPTGLTLHALSHVVAVCRGATDWSLYQDGVSLTPTYSGTGGALSNHANAGSLGRNGTAAAVGAKTLDLRVYNRAITSAEAWALYNQQTRWELYATNNAVYAAVVSGAFIAPKPFLKNQAVARASRW